MDPEQQIVDQPRLKWGETPHPRLSRRGAGDRRPRFEADQPEPADRRPGLELVGVAAATRLILERQGRALLQRARVPATEAGARTGGPNPEAKHQAEADLPRGCGAITRQNEA